MKIKNGFALLEMLIVIIIVGTLATLALINYRPQKEKVFDKECMSNLRLMSGAEKMYKVEQRVYYPESGGTENSHSLINSNLMIALPVGGTSNYWAYQVRGSDGCVNATRNGDDNRRWYLTIANADSGVGPLSGGCP